MVMAIGIMIQPRKVFEFDLGRKVGFRFNLLTLGKAAKYSGCSVDEVQKKMGLTLKKEGENYIQEQKPDIEVFCNFFFAAAENYAISKNIAIDFDAQDVSDWIEAVGEARIQEMINAAFFTPILKNTEAPQTEGQ